MHQKNDLPLSLKEGDTFNALCSDFDQILRSTLQGMEETEQDVAEINVKVKITLTADSAPDFEVRDHTRSITKPKFDHTVSSIIQHKEKKTGTLAGNYELVWDRETCRYAMRPIDNGQVSMFDKPTGKTDGGTTVVDAEYREVPALEGREVLGLPQGEKDGSDGHKNVMGYEKLKEYAGKEMCCEWTEDEVTCVIRCLNDGEVILEAAENPDADLEKHVGHDILCVAFEQYGKDVAAIVCDTCGSPLFTVIEGDDNDAIETVSDFDYLMQFEGVELICLEAMGIITVRAGSTVVISLSAPSGNLLNDDGKERLMDHIEHHLRITKSVNDDGSDRLTLVCDECNEVVAEFADAAKEDGGYEYEQPDVGEAV